MLQVTPSFYKIYSKNSLFISANTYEKNIVSNECCIACHDEKMCLLPNCRYETILIGNSKELLDKSDALCFNCQHVDCLYTLSKYRFTGKIVVKSGVHFIHQIRGVDRMSRIAKKWLLRKKYKEHL